MYYEDRIYGGVEITEPVLLDVMRSRAMTRLQGVLQHGISALVGITEPVSRFEHSMGAMLLVRRLGAPLPEQLAALLHDVSHTAFSHVIDYVIGSHDSQSYHDEMKADYVAQTDLPDVLARHGFDWRDFLDEAAYPLLEQPAPALCADRVDYFLRDSLDLGVLSPDDVDSILPHLVAHAGRMMVDDLDIARLMAYRYIDADDSSWADFREVGLYELAARAIKAGLGTGVITEADFWGTDVAVWEQLSGCDDPAVRAALALVSPQTRFAWDEAAPTFTISTKIRTIDPDVIFDGQALPLSALDADFARFREDYLRRKSGKWPMRVIPPNGG